MIIHSLTLLSPLYYDQEAGDPFNITETGEGTDSSGERIFCFELDEGQYRNFEPDRNMLLGKLILSGVSYNTEPEAGKKSKTQVKLPKGNYIFAQQREILCREDIISLALEIQLEGLWQRLELGKKLYLRYLFEDNSWVTQLFRPYTGLH